MGKQKKNKDNGEKKNNKNNTYADFVNKYKLNNNDKVKIIDTRKKKDKINRRETQTQNISMIVEGTKINEIYLKILIIKISCKSMIILPKCLFR